MRSKTTVILPLALILNADLSTSAKVIYAILKSFQTGQARPSGNVSVVVTHAELIESSYLSKKTVTKALNQLENAGWIEQQRNSGSANKYIFTMPAASVS